MKILFNDYDDWDSIILSIDNKLGESVKDKILLQLNLMFGNSSNNINIISINIISGNEHYFRILVSFHF